MKNILLISLILLFCPYWLNSKTLTEKIESGKTLVIDVTPIGDAWSNPLDKHTLKIYKNDSVYIFELCQNKEIKKKTISKSQLMEISEFISKWKDDRFGVFSSGLSYDKVTIKIGVKTRSFRTIQFSDKDLINKYFKE